MPMIRVRVNQDAVQIAMAKRNMSQNLLAAGRLLSVEPVANELLRPIQGCILMDEAAGTAAALAVLDVKELQKQLRKQGVILPDTV